MNEVSNGPAGNQEYVEFVVVSNAVTYTCTNLTPPCIDIRGWIFDDNSGLHGGTTGTGVAPGAVRFANNAIWSCVPLGTIILIYNNSDRNTAIPPDDLSMADGNCTIIAPLNSALFESNSTTPGAIACSYPATGWTAGGNWNNTVFANTGDCARIVDLGGCEVFSVCYGAANTNNLIYFTGNGGQKVYYFNNGNPSLQANWTSGSASPSPGDQTPGAPNNAANAAYIAQFNNGCLPITQPTVTAVPINAGCSCNGSATASTSGSIGGYTYVWYDASMTPIGQTSATATGLCAGVYHVISTSYIGCTATTSVTITSSSTTSVTVNSSTVCAGTSAILTATPSTAGGTFSWTPGGQATSSISVSPGSTTTYTVTYTLAGCSGTNNGIVTVKPLPTVTVNSPTICAGQTASLTANGATTYVWNTSSTTNPLTVSPATNTNFTVIGTINGCTNTAVSIVSVTPLPTVTVNSPTICSGQTASLTANGATTYVWNTGSTTNPLTVSPTTNTNFTVTGTTNGCTNTAVSSIVVNSNPTVTVSPPMICSGQTATLTASGASSYVWDTGAITNTIVVSPTSTTSFTVLGISVGCTNTAVASVSVTPLPTVTVSSPTICSGQTATLTANGATTYTWNTGSAINPLTVSPITNTSFTVTGATNGCINEAVSNVVVNSNPTVTVNSSTICAGLTATLSANGASTYIWNTGATTNTITDNPGSTTIYTVTGNLLGCVNTATASISINANLSLSVNNPTICSGQTTTLTTIGATTYTWSNGSVGSSIVISPANTSTFSVIGETGACSGSTLTTVVVNPLPTVTVNSSTICSGQTATLTANGATSYIWNSGSTTNTLSVTPTTNTNYTVTGTALGCINTAIANVTVTPLPLVTVNSSTICSGQTATLTANGATSYSWNTGSLSNILTDSPTTSATYTVIGTALGCINTAIANVSFTPLPTVTVNSSTICAGQTATLIANGASSYFWDTGSLLNPLIISPITNTSYTVFGTTSGCVNSATTNVMVVSSPVLIVNAISICAGETATLNVSGASSYNWSTGATSTSITVNPTTTTTYSVTGSLGACSSSTNVNVTVNQLPIVTVQSKTICAGQTATLTATGAINYNWNTGSFSNIISVTPNTTTIYSVTGTNNGCSASNTVAVLVNPAPSISFTASVFSGCAPVCVQFTDLTTVGSGTITNWDWTFNDGSSSNLQNPFHCFDNAGLYDISLTVTSSNGCSITIASPNYVNVFPNPIAEFTSNALETDILNPIIDFTNLSSNATSYSWFFGDGSSSVLTNPSHTYNDEGVYTTTLTAINQYGCKDIMIHDIIINGIFTFYAPNTFTPNEDNVNNVFLPLGVGWDLEKYELNIFDRWGNNCFNTKEVGKGWDGRANNGSEPAQIDTYIWKVDLTDVFGKNHKYIGRITIIK